METTSRFLALVALGGAMALAACGGSPDIAPVASTTTGSSDDAAFTASGNGPGGPASPSPGTGTCTHDCDGTGRGPGPGAGPGNGAGNGPGPGDGLCGDACTGPVGPDPGDIATVLGRALQEEYNAQHLYESVLVDYPGAAPFAAIVQAEMRHVEALQMLFARRQVTAPAWVPGPFPAFTSLPEACAAGAAAERADAVFYTPYLSRTDLPQDVRNVFTNLQAASVENHLPAFERCQ